MCVNDIIGTGLIELDKILILIVTLVLEPLLLLALEGCLHGAGFTVAANYYRMTTICDDMT